MRKKKEKGNLKNGKNIFPKHTFNETSLRSRIIVNALATTIVRSLRKM
jgi:hypothetical protein